MWLQRYKSAELWTEISDQGLFVKICLKIDEKIEDCYNWCGILQLLNREQYLIIVLRILYSLIKGWYRVVCVKTYLLLHRMVFLCLAELVSHLAEFFLFWIFHHWYQNHYHRSYFEFRVVQTQYPAQIQRCLQI